MGALRDAILADPAQQAPTIIREHHAPTGWEPGVRYDAAGLPSEVTTEQVPGEQLPEGQWGDLVAHLLPMVPAGHVLRLVEARYDPVAWTREQATTRIGDAERKTPATTRPAWRYRFRIVPADQVPAATDSADLVALIRAHRHTPARRTKVPGRTFGISDLQTGKTDAAGGSSELLERLELALDRVDDAYRRAPCENLVIADPGDILENFFNTTQQATTNDLALPDQMRVARVALTEIITRLSARADRTRVLTVPSNHGQWRTSMGESGRAGRPDADWGIDIHRAVAEKFAFAGRSDVSFIQPKPWEESLAIEVVPGFVLGLVHGHQWRPGKAGDWWARQTHGDAPTAAAHVLMHGHWHNASLAQSGYLDGRPRWIVGLDPMDGGSSWWRNLTGEQSEPSITVFDVRADGRWDNYRRITCEPEEVTP